VAQDVPVKDPILSIIIVNWNSRKYLDSCLKSIRESGIGVPHEIIVVDNASHDGSREMVRDRYREVKYIQCEVNRGFSNANNVGFEQSLGRYLLFLNPDTEIRGNAVNEMVRVLSAHPDAGAVGCTLLNPDGTCQTSCIQSFPTIMNQVLDSALLRKILPKSSLWGTAPLFSETGGIYPVDVISGACIMLKREMFISVGRFSREYFMYSEDVDMCYRISMAGYKNLYIRNAYVVHHGGASTSKTERVRFVTVVMNDSKLKFFIKYRGNAYAALYRVAMGVNACVRLALILFASPVYYFRNRAMPLDSLYKWSYTLAWGIGPGSSFDNCVRPR
jgi:GT2 family glycosyltransferase